ncbi:sigma-70 family RNA polymerase sigma factor [Pradoshia sp.]
MDELTIERIAVEDREILIDELMHQYGQEILQLAYSYVNSREIAEDLTQEIFVKCYKALHTYKGKSKVRTWLWRIAINHCKDYLKSWYNNHVIPSSDELVYSRESQQSTEHTVIQHDEDARLAHAVMKLPVNYREVIYLHYFEDMPIREIAAVLSVKENTVKTRLRRGKAVLKESLGGISEWRND